jgi:hypothetical protein
MDSNEVADGFDAWRWSGAVDLVIEFLYAGLFPVGTEHMVCGLDWLWELKEVKSDRRGLTVEDGKFDFWVAMCDILYPPGMLLEYGGSWSIWEEELHGGDASAVLTADQSECCAELLPSSSVIPFEWAWVKL